LTARPSTLMRCVSGSALIRSWRFRRPRARGGADQVLRLAGDATPARAQGALQAHERHSASSSRVGVGRRSATTALEPRQILQVLQSENLLKRRRRAVEQRPAQASPARHDLDETALHSLSMTAPESTPRISSTSRPDRLAIRDDGQRFERRGRQAARPQRELRRRSFPRIRAGQELPPFRDLEQLDAVLLGVRRPQGGKGGTDGSFACLGSSDASSRASAGATRRTTPLQQLRGDCTIDHQWDRMAQAAKQGSGYYARELEPAR